MTTANDVWVHVDDDLDKDNDGGPGTCDDSKSQNGQAITELGNGDDDGDDEDNDVDDGNEDHDVVGDGTDAHTVDGIN